MTDPGGDMNTAPGMGNRGPDSTGVGDEAQQADNNRLSTLGHWAVYYASQGMHIFPLKPLGKKPLIAKADGGNGFYDGTKDVAKIKKWWQKWPDANIGWWPGPSGHVAVDCDEKHGYHGVEVFETYLATYTNYPDTLVQETTTGGLHYVYRLPDGMTIDDPGESQLLRNGGEKTGIDVKSSKGYIVLAPSVLHRSAETVQDRDRYRWRGTSDFRLADAALCPPSLLNELARTGSSEGGSGDSPIRGIPTEQLLANVPDGERNVILFKTACRLWTQTGDKIAVALRIFHAANEAVPPYPIEKEGDESGARDIVERACAYPRFEVPDWTPEEDRPAVQAAVDAEYQTEKANRKRSLRINAEAREELELEQRGRPDGFTLQSDADIANRPPQRYLVPNLLPETGIFQIYGPTGTFKSFIWQDLLRCVATGELVLGHYPVLRTGPVLYVAAEGGSDLAERRMAWIIAHGGVVPDQFFTLDNEGIDLMLRHDVGQLIALCHKEMPAPPVLIGFDTQSLHMPSGDEDKARDLNVVIGNMKRLSDEFGALVGGAHHTGKDVSRGPRGSSSGPGAWDAILRVERNRIIPEKNRSGVVLPAFAVRMLPVDLGVDDLGSPRSSLVPQWVDMPVIDLAAESHKLADRDAERRQVIVTEIRGAPGCSKTRLRAAVNARLRASTMDGTGMHNMTLDKILTELETEGLIAVRKGRWFPIGEDV